MPFHSGNIKQEDEYYDDSILCTIKIEDSVIIKQEPKEKIALKSELNNEGEAKFKHEDETGASFEFVSVETPNMFTCVHCDELFTNRYYLNKHLLSKHPGETLKCKQCDNNSFKDKRLLKDHIHLKHPSEFKAKCTQCNFSTKFNFDLKRHVLMKHTERNESNTFKCLQCDSIFLQKSSLKSHVDRKHTEYKLVKCSVAQCNYSTKVNKDLKRHVERVHYLPIFSRMLTNVQMKQ